MTLVLPTDAELVDAAGLTYAANSVPAISDIDSAIRVFVTTRADGLNIVAIEGTHNPLGWALDFFGLRVTDQQGIDHATLGWLHAGFYGSAVAMLTRIALIATRGPYAICGHSLGAVLALIVGALLIDDQLPPVKIGAFAPPRGGGDIFVKKVTSVPFCAYRFGNDPIPEIPIRIPGFPYEQIPLTQVGQSDIYPFSCHSIGNYVSAIHALEAAT